MSKIFNWLFSHSNRIKYTSLSLSKTEGHFRSTVWDPFLIITQMIAMQSIYYLSLGFCLNVLCYLVGTSRSLDHIFKYQEIHIRDNVGKIVIIAFLLNAIIGAYALLLLIQRMKLCLDFSSTVHFYHLLACWYYNSHFPTTYSWWFLNIVCLAIMCIYGEFLCIRSELRLIPLSMSDKMDV